MSAKGVRSIEGCKPSIQFTMIDTKHREVNLEGLPTKLLKGEYQLVFEFINKFLVPKTKK